MPGSGDALRPAGGSEDGAFRVGCWEEMNPAQREAEGDVISGENGVSKDCEVGKRARPAGEEDLQQ